MACHKGLTEHTTLRLKLRLLTRQRGLEAELERIPDYDGFETSKEILEHQIKQELKFLDGMLQIIEGG